MIYALIVLTELALRAVTAAALVVIALQLNGIRKTQRRWFDLVSRRG